MPTRSRRPQPAARGWPGGSRTPCVTLSAMPASVAVLAILWAVAVWRAPTAWQEPWKRAPWLSVVCLAAALTADLPPVTGFIDGTTGMPELATLIKVLGGTGAVAAATAGVRAARSPSRPATLLDARHLPA